MKKEKIIIFDTTLRDGEQSPGATMSVPEKIRIASLLDEMGVDVIEAGFAISSDGDFEAINKIAKNTKNASVCSLARAKAKDIERAYEAIKPAKNPRIHTFISTSDIHIKHQFKTTREGILEQIKDSVSLAKKLCSNVEWSAMDATRSDKDYLCKALEVAIKNGATTVNIPDTVGYALPDEYGQLIHYIKNNVQGIEKVIISVHCQNDLGLATANSLMAIKAGARQIECTINGIGERAGNTSLEEVVMAIKTRNNLLPFETSIKTQNLVRASKLVCSVTGLLVQSNKAIVGANAFAHESGIHQDGMIKNASTYEIMDPKEVGWKKSEMVLGKHSGRNAFKEKLLELNFKIGEGQNLISNDRFEKLFEEFKTLSDKKKKVYDEDIVSLINEEYFQDFYTIKFKALEINCGSKKQQAKLELEVDGKIKSATANGQGPVDAIFKAINEIYPHKASLQLYQVHAVTEGSDALAEVTVKLYDEKKDETYSGHGANVDTMVASTIAYLSALNKMIKSGQKRVGVYN